MSAAGTINVNSATNDVATLAATTSTGTLTYQDANALTVGTVAAAGNFPGATGVSTTGTATTIDLKTGGLLTISNDIAAANNATVYLTSAAGITEGAAKITTRSEERRVGTGTINVNSATNDVQKLAATTSTGTLNYADAMDL